MVITYGTRYVGTVAKTPTGLSIGTLFFHVMWIPLFPLQAALLRDGEPIVGMPLSVSSVVLGYLRTLFVLAPIYGLMTAGLPSLILTLPLFGSVYGLSHLLSRAGTQQAINLEKISKGNELGSHSWSS